MEEPCDVVGRPTPGRGDADDRPDARARHRIDGNAQLLQGAEGPDLREAASAPAAEDDTDAAADEEARHPVDVVVATDRDVVMPVDGTDAKPFVGPAWVPRARRVHEHELGAARHLATTLRDHLFDGSRHRPRRG